MSEQTEAALDPNTPPNILLILAKKFPYLVLVNPLLPLIALENPALWEQIKERANAAVRKDKLVKMLWIQPRWQEWFWQSFRQHLPAKYQKNWPLNFSWTQILSREKTYEEQMRMWMMSHPRKGVEYEIVNAAHSILDRDQLVLSDITNVFELLPGASEQNAAAFRAFEEWIITQQEQT